MAAAQPASLPARPKESLIRATLSQAFDKVCGLDICAKKSPTEFSKFLLELHATKDLNGDGFMASLVRMCFEFFPRPPHIEGAEALFALI